MLMKFYHLFIVKHGAMYATLQFNVTVLRSFMPESKSGSEESVNEFNMFIY